MCEENEQNWIRGVQAIIAHMEHAATESDHESTFEIVKGMYRTMMSAKDGFGDYVIWRDDFQDRVQVNREFDALRAEVWHLLMDTPPE